MPMGGAATAGTVATGAAGAGAASKGSRLARISSKFGYGAGRVAAVGKNALGAVGSGPNWGELKPGTVLKSHPPLFPRIEVE